VLPEAGLDQVDYRRVWQQLNEGKADDR
jgi:hypothetical protein